MANEGSDLNRLAELALRGHFEGKRSHERQPVEGQVLLGRGDDLLIAELRDMSRTGFLAEIMMSETAGESLESFALRLLARFGEELELHLIDEQLALPFTIVRAQPAKVAAGTWYLAGRFDEPLSDDQCARAGLAAD